MSKMERLQIRRTAVSYFKKCFENVTPAAFDSSKLLENFLNVSFKYFPSNCFYLTSQGPVREAMLDFALPKALLFH